jgi:putative Holliday junction resolvase
VARIIGLDVGSKRVGVAVSDETGVLASPRGAIVRRSYNRDAAAIADLVAADEAIKVVVGLPVGLSGQRTEQTARVERFASMLATRLSVPVELWDERLTTVLAHHVDPSTSRPQSRKEGRPDAIAAAFILQGYLDHQRGS